MMTRCGLVKNPGKERLALQESYEGCAVTSPALVESRRCMTEHEREFSVLGQLWSGAPLSNQYFGALEKLTDPYQDVLSGGHSHSEPFEPVITSTQISRLLTLAFSLCTIQLPCLPTLDRSTNMVH